MEMIVAIIISLAAVVLTLFASMNSFVRNLGMLAGIIVTAVFGFKNSFINNTGMALWSSGWWNVSVMCLAGITMFFVFYFAEREWRIYDTGHINVFYDLFGNIRVERETTTHTFRWWLLSFLISIPLVAISGLLQNAIFHKDGFLVTAISACICLIIFIVHTVKRIQLYTSGSGGASWGD